jgi:hypothetical protein
VLSRRAAAVVSLLLLAAAVVLAVVAGVQRFPSGLSVLACVLVALAAAWWALVRRGPARIVGAVRAGVALFGAVVLVVVQGWVLADALVLAAPRATSRPPTRSPKSAWRGRRRSGSSAVRS